MDFWKISGFDHVCLIGQGQVRLYTAENMFHSSLSRKDVCRQNVVAPTKICFLGECHGAGAIRFLTE
jgi:hypothetical protein